MKFTVKSIVPAISTGRHNAFTGLCAHRGRYYLACRSAASHMSESGDITVSLSDDGCEWRPFARIAGGAGRDLRDPKPVVFDGAVWIFTGVRENGALYGRTSTAYRLGEDGSAAGYTLQGLPQGFWLWSVTAAADGSLLGSCYGAVGDQLFECLIVTSTDAIHWRTVCRLPWHCGETALDWRDGCLYGLGRVDREPFHPEYFRLSAEGEILEHRTLPVVLHGPFLKRLDGGCLLIGRHWTAPEFRDSPSVEMWFLADSGELRGAGTLLSRLDCSYAGYCQVDRDTALVSYYSSIRAGLDVTDVFVARIAMRQEEARAV